MVPPFTLTKPHDLWHEPLLVKREVCETLELFKEKASRSKKGKKIMIKLMKKL